MSKKDKKEREQVDPKEEMDTEAEDEQMKSNR